MKKQNGFVKILLIIIALIAVAVFIYIRMGYRTEVIPNGITNNKTVNWKIYHDEKYNFEFKYPENYILSSTINKNRQSMLYGSEVPMSFRAEIRTPDLLYKRAESENGPVGVTVSGAEFIVEASFIGKMSTAEWLKKREEKKAAENAEEELLGQPITAEKIITINGKTVAMFERDRIDEPMPTLEGEDSDEIFPYSRLTTFYVEKNGVEVTIRLFTINRDKSKTLSTYETILSTIDFK